MRIGATATKPVNVVWLRQAAARHLVAAMPRRAAPAAEGAARRARLWQGFRPEVSGVYAEGGVIEDYEKPEEDEEEHPRAVDSELNETMVHEFVKKKRKRRPKRGHKKEKKFQQTSN